MTVASSTNKTIAYGNGATTAFTFPFIMANASYAVVIYTDPSGAVTTLNQAQYSVSLNAPAAGALWGIGGSVTYPLSGSPIPNGSSLTILRQVPYTQATSIINQGGYYPDVLEAALDNLTFETQQLAELSSRTLYLPAGDTASGALPTAAQRAGLVLGFDANGNIIVVQPGSGSGGGGGATVLPGQSIQSAINAVSSAVISGGDTIGAQPIIIGAGKYALSSGLTCNPYHKLQAYGTVELNFSTAGSNVTAIRCRADTNMPAAASVISGANMGPWFNGQGGAFAIQGPGQSGVPGSPAASIGLDLGNAAATGTAVGQFRDTIAQNFVISGFGTAIQYRMYDTYLTKLCHFHLEDNDIGITTQSGTVTNSGERIMFFDGVIAGCDIGIYQDVDGFDFECLEVSFDYLTSSVFKMGQHAIYSRANFTKCHFEQIAGPIIDATAKNAGATSGNVAQNQTVHITRCNFVTPRSSVGGIDAPNRNLFVGSMDLFVKDFVVGGYGKPYHLADGSIYMCDSHVNIRAWENVRSFELSSRQYPAAQLTMNSDPLFAACTLGQNLNVNDQPYWHRTFNDTLSCVVDNTHVWTAGGATQSLKLYGATSNVHYYVLHSDRRPVNAGDVLTHQVVIYGGTSTGNIQINTSFVTYSYKVTPSVPIYSIQNLSSITDNGVTQSSEIVTVTTTVPHGLVAGQYVSVYGSDQAQYNRTVMIQSVPSSTTFTYQTCGNGSGTFIPNNGSASAAYLAEQYVPTVGYTVGSQFGPQIYGDTTNAAYTGNRLFWAREQYLHEYVVPPGADFVRTETTFTSFNTGDVIWVGALMFAKT